MRSSRRGVSTSKAKRAALAVSARCDDERIYVTLTDGREMSMPLTERLRRATPAQRRACYVYDSGAAIRWDEIDEDVGVHSILGVPEDEVLELAGYRPGMPEK